jgi:predicted membrane metal-binding protein
MLYTLAVILIVAWLLGFISDFTLGGFIHILLLAAIILIVVRLLQGKKI